MAQARDEAGNIWDVTDPNNPVLIRAAGQAPQMPADPTFPYQGAKAQADTANAQANARKNAVDAEVTAATAPAVITKTEAEAAKAAAEAERISEETGKGRPALNPQAYAEAMAKAAGAKGLSSIIADLEEKYKAGPGSTKGFRGVQDFFHSPGNERFDYAANSARGTVAKALGFTGGQLNSAVEAKYNLGAYIPKSSNFDGTIEDAIARLKQLQQDAFTDAVATLGGVPDANGRITPIPEGVPLNAMTVPRIIAGDIPKAAEFGADKKGVPINPEYQRDYTAWVQENAGNLDPNAYAAMRAELDRKYDYGVTDPRVFLEEGERIRKQLERGGSINLDIPNSEAEMTFGDKFRHNLVTHPVGAGVLGAADMGGFGVPTMLAPGQMHAATEAQPFMSALGGIGGAMTGTALLGKGVGLATKGAITPRMSAYGRMKFGKNGVSLAKEAGTDAAYSAIYGMNTGQDPLESAGWGTAGTMIGRGGSKMLGTAAEGVKMTPAAERMRALGQHPTVGQSIGGWAKAAEEKATSLPLVGDIINARHMEGRAGFNRGAFNIGGAPIGQRIDATGRVGIDDLRDAKNTAYGKLDNVQLDVTDPAVAQDVMNAQFMAGAIPQGVGDAAANSLEYRIGDATPPSGMMGGRDFQEAYRGLGRDRRTMQPGGYQHEYDLALREGQDALATGLETQNPGAYADFLAANAANRRLEVLADAVNSAKNQEDQLFTPKQLQTADANSTTRLTGRVNSASGRGPFAQYADDGVEVFSNNTPNSGTADRAAQMALGGGMLTGGASLGGILGAVTGDGQNTGNDAAEGAAGGTLSTLGLMGLLALGGTKRGQRVLSKAMFDRPEAMKTTGAIINTRRGLFGRAMLPFALSPAWSQPE